MFYKAIRIVNSNTLWQDNENGWSEISVYDETTGLIITEGHDNIRFENPSGVIFMVEAKMNKPGLVYFGATFELKLGFNTLEIVISKS